MNSIKGTTMNSIKGTTRKTILVKLFFCVLIFSTGCSSTPGNEQYYVLGTSATVVEYQPIESKTVVTLHTVELADFLQNDQLIMQIGDHQIQKANYHFWAEDLTDAITRELMHELKIRSTTLHFESSGSSYIDESGLSLYVIFNQFHPNDQSAVVMAGKYWLVDKQKKHKVTARDFVFNASLEKDGYTHAVEQLRILLGELSKHILTAIE